MEILIAREDVVNLMCDSLSLKELFDRLFDEVPIVESRPKGKWIDNREYGYVECPFCHEATNCDGNIEKLHYCWNCGAELRVDVRGDE